MANRPMVSCSTGAMNSLLDKLTKLKNHSTLKDLQKDLESLNDFLDKFAGGRETDEQVKVWKKQVRELVYDIEDWIEPKPPPNLGESEIKQMEEFKAQIDEARERCQRYGLLKKAPISDANPADVRPSKVAIDSRPLWEEKTVLVAVDDPKKELEEHLKNKDEKLKVVSIVGMEGHGKTTLAKEIYGKLQGQFECQAFVSVGRRPSMTTTLMDILRQVKQDPKLDILRRVKRQVKQDPNSHGVQVIITELWEFLSTKRYFILIDGIGSTWDWKVINCALPDKSHGSRVLTTTCIMDVAKSCSIRPSDVIYQVKPLSEKDSGRLFRNRISVREEESPVNFKEVSDDMLKLCGGMPLAIIVTAGLLAWKSAELGPSKRLENTILSASDQYSTSQGMGKILHISYSDLSLPVKSCFMYLSVFPENHTIKKDRLIRLWVAEGFIPKRDEESLWETGESYFNELVSRRLIQPVFHDDDVQAVGCTVHGVIRDFIASLSSKENFVTAGAELRSGPFPCDTIRRFSLDCGHEDEADTLASNRVHLSRVRSLTVFGDVEGIRMPFLSPFKLIRVLDLEDSKNLGSDHLEGIASLSMLRYLGLGDTGDAPFRESSGRDIGEELEEIGKLQHLQTLDLRRTGLTDLPASINGLQKLVSLLGDGLRLASRSRIANMQDLEELSTIDVNSSSSSDAVLELLDLTSKRLRMLGVKAYCCDYTGEYAHDVNVMSFLNKLGKSNLESLIIDGDLAVLDDWAPSPHLRRFRLEKFLPRVPEKWASLDSLTYLDIRIDQVAPGDLLVLGKLPNLSLLKLHSRGYDTAGCIVSTVGFKSIELAWFMCPHGGMGLHFEYGAMRKLRRLRLDFNAGKTSQLYGNKFDFGIQFPSSLAQVHVTINCKDSRFSEVYAAEDAIRDQVSRHPKNPSLVLIRHGESESPTESQGMSMDKASASTS